MDRRGVVKIFGATVATCILPSRIQAFDSPQIGSHEKVSHLPTADVKICSLPKDQWTNRFEDDWRKRMETVYGKVPTDHVLYSPWKQEGPLVFYIDTIHA